MTDMKHLLCLRILQKDLLNKHRTKRSVTMGTTEKTDPKSASSLLKLAFMLFSSTFFHDLSNLLLLPSPSYSKSNVHYPQHMTISMYVVVVWWCRPHPVREHAQDLRPLPWARPASPAHMSSSAATPTGSVHKSQTVSVVGMSGQLKRCNESWFGSLQSGQFAVGWLAGSILCR